MRQWRLAHGLTLKEMAAAINERVGFKFTSQPNLSRVEVGEREYRQDLLEAYADVLNCTPGMLLSRPPRVDPEAIWRSINEEMQELADLTLRQRDRDSKNSK